MFFNNSFLKRLVTELTGEEDIYWVADNYLSEVVCLRQYKGKTDIPLRSIKVVFSKFKEFISNNIEQVTNGLLHRQLVILPTQHDSMGHQLIMVARDVRSVNKEEVKSIGCLECNESINIPAPIPYTNFAHIPSVNQAVICHIIEKHSDFIGLQELSDEDECNSLAEDD